MDPFLLAQSMNASNQANNPYGGVGAAGPGTVTPATQPAYPGLGGYPISTSQVTGPQRIMYPETLEQRAIRELREWSKEVSNFIHFHDAEGQLVFSLKRDGSIHRGPGFTTDEEAAMLFWRTVGEAFPMFKFSESVK